MIQNVWEGFILNTIKHNENQSNTNTNTVGPIS